MNDYSAQRSQSALGMKRQRRKQSGSFRGIQALVLCFAWILAFALTAQAQELSNDTLRLKLNVTPQGIPVIEEAVWQATGQTVFSDLGTPDGLSAWVPVAFIPAAQTTTGGWSITEGDDLTTAEATCELTDKVLITWIVELPKQGQLFRLHVRLTNRGKLARAFDSFPAWSASWDVAGQSQWARWWRSLEFNRIEQTLNSTNRIRLGSRLYSSDDEAGGVNPYIGSSTVRIAGSISVCSGVAVGAPNSRASTVALSFRLVCRLRRRNLFSAGGRVLKARRC